MGLSNLKRKALMQQLKVAPPHSQSVTPGLAGHQDGAASKAPPAREANQEEGRRSAFQSSPPSSGDGAPQGPPYTQTKKRGRWGDNGQPPPDPPGTGNKPIPPVGPSSQRPARRDPDKRHANTEAQPRATKKKSRTPARALLDKLGQRVVAEAPMSGRQHTTQTDKRTIQNSPRRK